MDLAGGRHSFETLLKHSDNLCVLVCGMLENNVYVWWLFHAQLELGFYTPCLYPVIWGFVVQIILHMSTMQLIIDQLLCISSFECEDIGALGWMEISQSKLFLQETKNSVHVPCGLCQFIQAFVKSLG